MLSRTRHSNDSTTSELWKWQDKNPEGSFEKGLKNVCTFGNKGARPAQRRGAAGCGVTAKEGLGLIHEEAFALLQRGGLHGQESGILKFRVGAGDGAGAKWAGTHRKSKFVGLQLWQGTTTTKFLKLYT